MTIPITAKKVKVSLKNGLTPEDMAAKYGCTIPELKEQLERIYGADDGTKAQELYKQLEENRKKPRRKKQPSPPISEPEVVVPDEPVEEPEEDLYKNEETLSSEVIKLESQHKELSSKHRDCNKELRRLQSEITDIIGKLDEYKSRFNSVVSQADSIAVQMNAISSLRKERLATLEEVRRKIREKNTVSICVSSDGNIEVLDSPDFVINDEGFQALKAELADREECLDLRVRDIAILARLLKICENVEHVMLICDQAELEKAFWAIRGK